MNKVSEYMQKAREAIRQAQVEMMIEQTAAQERRTFIIWREERNSQIDRDSSIVGIFVGTHDEADALIARLASADPSVSDGWCRTGGYFRTEPPVITPQNESEFTQDL